MNENNLRFGDAAGCRTILVMYLSTGNELEIVISRADRKITVKCLCHFESCLHMSKNYFANILIIKN